YIEGKLAHFFCVVPKYYRWPFMKDKDVQITYVITEEAYKGRGFAFKGISQALNRLPKDGDVWYVTDTDNIPSQKLALKLGFELYGEGYREKSLGGLVKILRIK